MDAQERNGAAQGDEKTESERELADPNSPGYMAEMVGAGPARSETAGTGPARSETGGAAPEEGDDSPPAT